ncbi:MAG TPA: hypothetical protein VF395_14330, partial [Polyangiaceae bacterium]
MGTRRASDWLKVAEAHAPAGFDDTRDGVVIHRSGTVLYVCALVPRLLGLERMVGPVAGSPLLDLFDQSERERVAWVLGQAGEGEGTLARTTLLPTPQRSAVLELIALSAQDASPPIDVLYLCSNRAQDPSEGDQRELERR